VPLIYNEDEHANDVTAEETFATADMAVPSEDTDEMGYQVMPKAG
jgi:hypothetical protein